MQVTLHLVHPSAIVIQSHGNGGFEAARGAINMVGNPCQFLKHRSLEILGTLT